MESFILVSQSAQFSPYAALLLYKTLHYIFVAIQCFMYILCRWGLH